MDVVIHIPDDLAQRIGAAGDLPRRALEALAIEEYRSGHFNKAGLRRLLGLATRDALDGVLKAHGLYTPYTLDDFEQERSDLERLGF